MVRVSRRRTACSTPVDAPAVDSPPDTDTPGAMRARSYNQTELFLKNPSRFADVARAHVEEHARQDKPSPASGKAPPTERQTAEATAAAPRDGGGKVHLSLFLPARKQAVELCASAQRAL